MRLLAWIAAAAVFTAAAGQETAPPAGGRAAWLARLHDGRFTSVESTSVPSASQPENLFFTAFTTYWKLVFDDDDEGHQALFESQLDATIDATAKLESQASAALWAGNSHLLLAQLRAWERRPLSAAFEAKRAKKQLEAAVRGGAAAADASFGLGTYNYMADTLPGYVKGLRALLMLPKGNRQLGLDQLETAASESAYFALEARILLMTIYANKHERLYDRAIAQRDKLLAQAPDTVASLYASARLDVSLGRDESAVRTLARAGARAASFGDVDPVVLRSIELLRARAEFALFRPDLARATAAAALATHQGLSPAIRDGLTQVVAASDRLIGQIDWPNVLTSEGTLPSADRLAALASEKPQAPLLALLAGDASLRAGRPDEALHWFERASSTELPSALRAGCQLRQGQAADLLGQRARALQLYKLAADTPGFLGKDAAFYYQKTPYRADS